MTTEITSKNHNCCEIGESGQVPLVPPNKPKAYLYNKMFQKNYCRSILHLKRKQVQKFTKMSNKVQLINRLGLKLLFFG